MQHLKLPFYIDLYIIISGNNNPSYTTNKIHSRMCTLSNDFACISPITKNVGAILIQNEDLNALQITCYRYHTLSDTMSV